MDELLKYLIYSRQNAVCTFRVHSVAKLMDQTRNLVLQQLHLQTIKTIKKKLFIVAITKFKNKFGSISERL